MDVYDFVSGGGLYKTSAGYDANVTTILVKTGNTYPLIGYVSFTNAYTANVAWDANATQRLCIADSLQGSRGGSFPLDRGRWKCAGTRESVSNQCAQDC